MSPENVAITAVGPFTNGQINTLSCSLQGPVESVDTHGVARARGIPVAVRGGRQIFADRLTALQTPLVVSAGTGIENIQKGGEWLIANCPGGNAPEVAAHAWAMAHINSQISGVSLGNVGIIGPGHVGTDIARLTIAQGLPEPIFKGRKPDDRIRTVPCIAELAKKCGTIFVSTGAANIIGEDDARHFGPHHQIVNVGRGHAISEEALHFLRKRGVNLALDVWPEEIGPDGTIPTSMSRLMKLGVWGTMHEAARQPSADERVAEMVVKTILQFRNGVLPKTVDPITAYIAWREEFFRSNRTALIEGGADIDRVAALSRHLGSAYASGNVWKRQDESVKDVHKSFINFIS